MDKTNALLKSLGLEDAEPDVLDQFLRGVAGHVENDSSGVANVAAYLSRNPQQAEKLFGQMKVPDPIPPEDIEAFDYSSLTPTKESFLVAQLDISTVEDQEGNIMTRHEANVKHTDGDFKPTFTLYVYDEAGAFRSFQEFQSLPKSADVLRLIKQAIAYPAPPLKTKLPEYILISHKLSQHSRTLAPFLDSFPPPFYWDVETPEDAAEISKGIQDRNTRLYGEAMEQAAKLKEEGTLHFSNRDKEKALKCFWDAGQCAEDAVGFSDDAEHAKESSRLAAICFSNRAAVWLLDGPGHNAKEALEDVKRAERHDPDYAKLYWRWAKASMSLQQENEAIAVLRRALSRPALAWDLPLTELLIDIQTGGQGIPQDKEVLKIWYRQVTNNDESGIMKDFIASKSENLWDSLVKEQFKKLEALSELT